MRIAHFSDIHLTLSPATQGVKRLLGKRVMGALNYSVGGRGRHFKNVSQRIECLLADIDAQEVDHAICTGDVTQMSYPAEFAAVGELFGSRRSQPQRFTLIPGNHDRYTRPAVTERRFEAQFAPLCEGAQFPFSKTIGAGVVVIGLDVSRPTGLLSSSGLCGQEQRKQLRELLKANAGQQMVIVMLHYGLRLADGGLDKTTHGIEDQQALYDLVTDPCYQVDLVLHGHLHRPYAIRLEKRLNICVGSATDLHRGCGYNIYDVDIPNRVLSLHRRQWSEEEQCYVGADSPQVFSLDG